MTGEKSYIKKEMARLEVVSAMEKYLAAADDYEMGAQETADELTDIFIDSKQPYRVEV